MSIEEALQNQERARKLSRINLNPQALSSFFGKIDESRFKEGVLNRLKWLIAKLHESFEFFRVKSEDNGNLPNISRELDRADIYIKELSEEISDINKINTWILWISDKYGYEYADDQCTKGKDTE